MRAPSSHVPSSCRPTQRAIRGVDDSKALTAAERVRLAALIRERALAIGVGAASVREIDRLNIYHASTLAMRRALGRLAVAPDHVLIDGKAIRTLTIPHTAVVHGDARCFSIACASIIAKVTRDRLMHQLAERYPSYRWEQNVGYATRRPHCGARVGRAHAAPPAELHAHPPALVARLRRAAGADRGSTIADDAPSMRRCRTDVVDTSGRVDLALPNVASSQTGASSSG